MDEQQVKNVLDRYLDIDPEFLEHPPALTDPYTYRAPGGPHIPLEDKLAAMPRKGNGCLRVMLVYSNNMFDTLVNVGLSILAGGLREAGHEVTLFDTTFYHTEKHTSLKTTGDEARFSSLQYIPTSYAKFGITFEEGDVFEDFRKAVADFQPDLVGVSVLEMTHVLAVALVNSIADPDFLKSAGFAKPLPTIFGGPHVSSFGEKVFVDEPNIDMLCFREGYPAIVELADAMYKGDDLTGIPNIWTKDAAGTPVFPEPRHRPPLNLELLPDQDWSLWQWQRFMKPMGGTVRRTGVIIWQQGCPYACDFCIQNLYRALDGKSNYRERPIPKMINEVKAKTKEYEIEYWFTIAENALPVGKTEKFMEPFWEFIREWDRHVNLPFWMETRPETLQEEFRIKALAAINCEGLSVGVESGDPEIRSRIMSRHMDDQVIVDAFDNLNRCGQLNRWKLESEDLPPDFKRQPVEGPQEPDEDGWFYTSKFRIRILEREDYDPDADNPAVRGVANTIIGVPGESRETIMKTIRLAKRINAGGRVGVAFNTFIPLGGTMARDFAMATKLICEDHLVGDYRDPNQALDQPTLPADELRAIAKCCTLYVAFDESRWDEVRRAEQDPELFDQLAEEFYNTYMIVPQERKRILTPRYGILEESGEADEVASASQAVVNQ